MERGRKKSRRSEERARKSDAMIRVLAGAAKSIRSVVGKVLRE
jgi:hypothetical protein